MSVVLVDPAALVWLDQIGAPDFGVEVLTNGSGSAITAGAPCCLLSASFDGKLAGIPAATNLAMFKGVWLPNPDGSTSIPNGQPGRVQTKGVVQDPVLGTGLARVLGHASITAAGVFLYYQAGNDYFQYWGDLYDVLGEQASKIVSGEAYTTASVALKKIWLKG